MSDQVHSQTGPKIIYSIPKKGHDVVKEQLQLVGVTAMLLAAKYEEQYPPAIDDFVYITENTYSKADIRGMEIKIIHGINFMFGKPICLTFLRRFSKAGQVRVLLD